MHVSKQAAGACMWAGSRMAGGCISGPSKGTAAAVPGRRAEGVHLHARRAGEGGAALPAPKGLSAPRQRHRPPPFSARPPT